MAVLRFLSRLTTRGLWLLLAAWALVMALALGLRFYVLPNADRWRDTVAAQATAALGTPVEIGSLKADWRGLNPYLELGQVVLRDVTGAQALVLPQVQAVLSWRSLMVLEARFERLSFDAPAVEVQREADGTFVVAGIQLPAAQPGEPSRALDWLLRQGSVQISGAALTWVDKLRAAPPLTLEAITLNLRNSGRRHQMALLASSGAGAGGQVDFRVDMQHPFLSDEPADVSRWRGQVYARLTDIDVALLKPWVDLPVEVTAGRGRLEAWLELDQSRIVSVDADVGLDGVNTRLADGLPRLELQNLTGRVGLRLLEDGSRELSLANLDLRTPQGRLFSPGRLVLTWSEVRGALSARGVDLAAVSELARRMPLPEAVHDQLADLTPVGRVESAELRWQGPLSAPVQPTGELRVSDLGLGSAARGLRLEGISGELALATDRITLAIDASDLRLRASNYLHAGSLAFDRLVLDAVLRRGEGWSIRAAEVSRLEFTQPGTQARVRGTWTAGGLDGWGTIKAEGEVPRADVRQIHRFFPTLVSRDAWQWLAQGLVSGTAVDGRVKLDGELARFPFRQPGSGVFEVDATARGVTIDPLPAAGGRPGPWQRIDGIQGRFSMRQGGLLIEASQAQLPITGGRPAQLRRVRAEIADLVEAPRLKVSGDVQVQAADLLRYVRISPVRDLLDRALDDWRATGAVQGNLALDIPLLDANATRVQGQIRLAQNDLQLGPQWPALQRASGRIDFSETGFSLRDLQGTLLGGAFRIAGGPEADVGTVLRFSGQLTAQGLQRLVAHPLANRVSGQTAYAGSVTLRGTGHLPELRLDSTLEGLAIDLPAPLRKPAPDAWPLSAAMIQDASRPLQQLSVQIAGRFQAMVERRQAPGGAWEWQRGVVALRADPTLPARGLALRLEAPVLDVDGWQRALATDAPPATGAAAASPLPLPLLEVSLKTPQVLVANRQLGDLNAQGRKQASGEWTFDLESAEVAGRGRYRPAANARQASHLELRLSRLHIPRELGQDLGRRLQERPTGERLPSLSVVAESFELQDRQLGRLELEAVEAAPSDWRLDTLVLSNPDAVLRARGQWRPVATPGRPTVMRMNLETELELIDAGKLLARLGIPGALAGGRGTLRGPLLWNGLPQSFDLPSLDGDLELVLDRGQFLQAEPGLGRLLSVLSLQSLPRRVTLDFRDIFSAGFAFDTIRAQARIRQGLAATDNLRMVGPSATVALSGSVDLVRETQALRALVIPQVDASAASVLYGLAVNPAIGFGTFIAQLLLKDPLARVLSFEYSIQGSWADPQVTRVERRAPAELKPAE